MFKTIATFTLPSQLVVARTKLESEGIECRTLDELTIQTDNFLSNAIGGVKLQVQESDLTRASTILREGGFVNEKKAEPNLIEKKLSDPKFLSRLKVAARVFFIFLGIVFTTAIILSIFWRPSTAEKLTNRTWCLDHIIYDHNSYHPHTIGTQNRIRIILPGSCEEEIAFNEDGSLLIPGFQSRVLKGKWTLEGGNLRIFEIDTLGSVFEGIFALELSSKELVLTSDLTQINCIRSAYY